MTSIKSNSFKFFIMVSLNEPNDSVEKNTLSETPLHKFCGSSLPSSIKVTNVLLSSSFLVNASLNTSLSTSKFLIVFASLPMPIRRSAEFIILTTAESCGSLLILIYPSFGISILTDVFFENPLFCR